MSEIQNIIDKNQQNISTLSNTWFDTIKYDNYLKNLEDIKTLIINDKNNPKLRFQILSLLEGIVGIDNTTDSYISWLKYSLENVSLSDIDLIISKLWIDIDTQISKVNSIKTTYENEKALATKTTNRVATHLKNLNKINSVQEFNDYVQTLKAQNKWEYKELINNINELAWEDSEHWESWLDFLWEDYMSSEIDKEEIEKMTIKALNETANFLSNEMNNSNLQITLPETNEMFEFANLADKQMFINIMLRTLNSGISEDLKNWLGFLLWTIWIWIMWVWGLWILVLLKKPTLFISKGILWLLKKIPLLGTLIKKIHLPKFFKKSKWNSNESTSTESSTKNTTEAKVETKWDFMTRNRALEMISQFEKKHIDIIAEWDAKYDKLSFEIEKLKAFINNWKLDKAQEIQLWELLNYLNKNEELPSKQRSKFAEKVTEKTKSSKEWHDKTLKEKIKEWTWEKIWKRVAWKNTIIIPKIDEIKDQRKIKDFLKKLWTPEEKISITFNWENIEINWEFERLLSELESKEAEIQTIEKAEWEKRLYERLKQNQSKIELQLNNLESTIETSDSKWNKSSKTNPAYITAQTQLETNNNKIEVLIEKFNDFDLWDIENFNSDTEKTKIWNEINTKIDEIKTEMWTKTNTSKILQLTDFKSKRIKEIKWNILRALKKIKI